MTVGYLREECHGRFIKARTRMSLLPTQVPGRQLEGPPVINDTFLDTTVGSLGIYVPATIAHFVLIWDFFLFNFIFVTNF